MKVFLRTSSSLIALIAIASITPLASSAKPASTSATTSASVSPSARAFATASVPNAAPAPAQDTSTSVNDDKEMSDAAEDAAAASELGAAFTVPVGRAESGGGASGGGGRRRPLQAQAENSNDDESQPARKGPFPQIDNVIDQAMQDHAVPGAAIAITKDGKLVYARGYGLANIRSGEQATERTFFNLASCTKTISTFGLLRLQEAGKLDLDSPVYDVIGRPELAKNRVVPRVFQITVRQLMHHSGGWNDDSGFARAAEEVKQTAPNGMPYKDAVRILFMTPLDYAPGTDAKYANGQWTLLKYCIECASGMPYGEYLNRQLATIGITDMHDESRGHTAGEATRYRGNPPTPIAGGKRDSAIAFHFGNWMATPLDMAKFLTAIDGSRMQGISPKSFKQMIAPLPPPMVNRKNGSHFGLGLDVVKQTDAGLFFSKNGGKPGVHAQIEHLPNGVDFCFFMNGGVGASARGGNPMPINELVRLLTNRKQWPQGDLFSSHQ